MGGITGIAAGQDDTVSPDLQASHIVTRIYSEVQGTLGLTAVAGKDGHKVYSLSEDTCHKDPIFTSFLCATVPNNLPE